VKASQHLDWGAGGSLDVTSTGATHEITHAGSAGTKRIVTGQLHAPTHVRTPTIQANGQGITAAVNVRDTNGAHGFLDSAIVKSTNYLQTPTIRNTASGGTINVRDSGGGTTTLNVNALTTTNVTATNVTATTIRAVTSGATAAVNVRDSGGTANGFLNSAIIQTTNYLQTPTIRSTGTSDQGLVVNVRNNSNADNAILNASIVQTATIRNKDTGTSTQMRFRDSVGNDNVRIDARNAPYCLAKINAFGTPSFIRNYGFNNNSLSRISNITAGGYVLSFDTSDSKSSDDIMIFINPENQSNFLASVRIESDTIISIPFGPSVRRYFLEVRIRDISSNNNLSNSNFSILVYVH
jgi:imidazole glycerol phosphate synthase subunit HisF